MRSDERSENERLGNGIRMCLISKGHSLSARNRPSPASTCCPGPAITSAWTYEAQGSINTMGSLQEKVGASSPTLCSLYAIMLNQSGLKAPNFVQVTVEELTNG